ncbi:DUF4336 domain-containing protein [Roseibium sediminicola]|uniref:DUF4336 domain-containing protein n=1 Tax=Roseibium sediminicola TaxID=2933272 RepID=A0ABT0GNC8_9HYPH|nr:DUF4336 domain-containing protein [Roseibium sp. CAU 1639]MCK7610602.1 DUF4336 domain-containing protein [Roseibium sp. CAU 1639]
MTSAPVPVDNSIWILEGGNVSFYGFAYSTRCVIVRLPGGGLWVWSPIALTPEVRQRVEALGVPEHLVSPNKIHHLFLQDWKEAWPAAKLWGPQSTIDKRDDLAFEPALDEAAPPDWGGVIDLVRFAGSPAMDEVVFCHLPSKTAILADLSEHFSQGFLARHWKPWQRWIAGLWGIVEGKGYAPLEWRLSFFDRRKARACKARILAWSPDKVIMAHGEWQRSGGRAFLERALSWV